MKYSLDGFDSVDLLFKGYLRLKLNTEVGSACCSCKEDSKPFSAAFRAATLEAKSFNIKEKITSKIEMPLQDEAATI